MMKFPKTSSLWTAFATMASFSVWPFLSFLNNNQEDLFVYGWLIATYGLATVILTLVLAVLWLWCGWHSSLVPWCNAVGVTGFTATHSGIVAQGYGIADDLSAMVR